MLLNSYVVTLTALILGLGVGRLINNLAYKIPLLMEREWTDQCNEYLGNEPVEHSGSLLNPPRSIRRTATEIVTGMLSAFIVYKFGITVQGIAALILLYPLLTLTLIDLDHTLLPDSITLPLMWLGLIASLFNVFTSIESAVIGAIMGYMILWSITAAFKMLTSKDGMGHGDFKLLAALGGWLGYELVPTIIVLAAVSGLIAAMALIINNRVSDDRQIPFGPYLAVGGLLALAYGESINAWYLNIIIL